MSTYFRCTILVAAGLIATVAAERASSSSRSDVPAARTVTSAQTQSNDDNSRPTLKTPGVPSGTDPGAEPDASGGAPAGSSNAAASQPTDASPSVPSAPAASPVDSSQPLKGSSRVEIIREVDGEFAKAARALPGKKEGFTLLVGKPVDEQKMSDALRLQGTAIAAGEPVQVTQMDFETKRIVVQINGGTKKKIHLRDHLQVGVTGPYGPPDPQPVDHHEGIGAVIVLDYGRPLPDLTPDAVKQALSPLLDFSKEHSAAVNWVETLPQPFQDAIRDHKALPGMDQETVIAALGRPDRKVRERNSQGVETEDWIYGNPPARTVFVTFIGDKVTKVEEFN